MPSTHTPNHPANVENYVVLRFFACIVDGIIVSIAATALRQFIPFFPLLVNLALYIAYDTLMTCNKGATLGKMFLGLKVTDATVVKMPTQEQALTRAVIKAIPFVGIFLFIQMLMGKLALHDEMGKTRVVRV